MSVRERKETSQREVTRESEKREKKRTGRVTVVVLEDTSSNDTELSHRGRGEVATRIGRLVGGGFFVTLLVVESIDVFLNTFRLLGLVPHLVPILVDLGGSSSSDRIENVFSRVVVLGTPLVGTFVEVLDERRRVLAEITEVDSLSSLLKKEKSIEGLEEFRRRLMDSSEDSLSVIGELAKEEHD